MKSYSNLERRYREIDALDGASAILGWDAQTMMPEGSVAVRSEQLAVLAGVRHAKQTDAAIAEWLVAAESESLNDWQQANLREMKRSALHASALPADLVEALSKATTECEHIWRGARKANDYASFAKSFEQVLNLVREEAAAKATALGLSPYDALLDGYDAGMRSSMIDVYFAELESFLPTLVNEAIELQARKKRTPLTDKIPLEKQEKLGRELMKRLGFDFSRGRIDVSAHPFCGGVPGDIRLTTRYKEEAFADSLYGVLHETGHALYEMGLPEPWWSQPVGKARGMSTHESQSLLIEMQLCLSGEFLEFLLPLCHEIFGVNPKIWTRENLHRQLTHVERSLIRVTADELTYPLHVMLRYRLEKALLSGDLSVVDLPAAWDEMMKKYLGIAPDCVGNGCMQDVHWPSGAIGYFPTYTVGAMMAAQWMDTIRRAIPNLESQIVQGDFSPFIQWLRSHIHSFGSYYQTPELIEKATGQPLNVAIYKAHLTQRYVTA